MEKQKRKEMQLTENSVKVRRGRRRRDDIENKIYNCACQKAYYSYIALWNHIQRKHKGVRPEETPRSFRQKRAKRQSEKPLGFRYTENAQQCLENNEELIVKKFVEIIHQDESKITFFPIIKKFYEKDPFYLIYEKFQPESMNPKYNEIEDIFEESCGNVLCEFLCEVNFKMQKNFYRSLALIFVMMLAKGVIDENQGNIDILKEEPAINLGCFSNETYMKTYKNFRSHEVISHLNCFQEEKIVKLMELFYMWIRVKKYSDLSVKINYEYFF